MLIKHKKIKILIYPQCSQITTDVLRVSDPDSSPAELVFSSLGNLNTAAGHLEHQDYPGRLVLWLVRRYSALQIFLQPVIEVCRASDCLYVCNNRDRKQKMPEKSFDKAKTH